MEREGAGGKTPREEREEKIGGGQEKENGHQTVGRLPVGSWLVEEVHVYLDCVVSAYNNYSSSRTYPPRIKTLHIHRSQFPYGHFIIRFCFKIMVPDMVIAN